MCIPDQDLPQDFDARREQYFQNLGQPLEADLFVERLKVDLITALDAFDRDLPSNKDVTLKSQGWQNPDIAQAADGSG